MQLITYFLMSLVQVPAAPVVSQSQPVTQALAVARVSLKGIVRRLDGTAWSKARVFLHARTVPGLPGVGTVDRLSLLTDERGRFTAKILPHMGYLLWAASSEPGQDYRVTIFLEDVHAGRPVRLIEQESAFVQVSVDIEAGEDWKAQAPFSFVISNERAFSKTVIAGGAALQLTVDPDPKSVKSVCGFTCP